MNVRTILIAFIPIMMVPIALPVQAQSSGPALEIGDNVNDVRVEGTDATAPENPVSALADITRVEIYGETGLDISASVEVGSVTYDGTGTANVRLAFCFTLQDVEMAFYWAFLLKAGQTSPVSFQSLVVLTCTLDAEAFVTGQAVQGEGVFDASSKSIQMQVSKAEILRLLGEGAMIHQGDELTNLKAMSRVRLSGPRGFADAAPDSGTHPDPYILAEHTSNQHVKVQVVRRATSTDGAGALKCSGGSRHSEGIQAGTSQAIPILLQNDLQESTRVRLRVIVANSQFEASIMPEVDLPPVETPSEGVFVGGNRTVTLIVEAPGGNNKPCSQIRVIAEDLNNPMRTGEAVFDAIATPIPSKANPNLYLHSDQFATSYNRVWMNAAQEDPAEVAADAWIFKPSNSPQVGSSTRFTMQVATEVGYPVDLLLRTLDYVNAQVMFWSDPVPTNARITATLFSGATQLATGVSDVQIATQVSPVEVRMQVTPNDWATPTVRAQSDVPLVFEIDYAPQRAVADAPVPDFLQGQGAGNVYFQPKGSSLSLPIEEIVTTKNSKLGDEGGLVSLGLDPNERIQYVLNGRTVAYNFTVNNEGASVDSFEVSTSLSSDPPGIAWEVRVADGAQLAQIVPGQSGRFTLLVTAPADALDSVVARIVVTVNGTWDGASSTEIVTAQVSKLVGSGLETVPVSGPSKANTPQLGALPLIAGVAALALALRGRRK